MTDIATAKTRIAEIDTILAGGVRSVTTVEGDQVQYDLKALREERDSLKRIVASSSSSGFRRIVFRG